MNPESATIALCKLRVQKNERTCKMHWYGQHIFEIAGLPIRSTKSVRTERYDPLRSEVPCLHPDLLHSAVAGFGTDRQYTITCRGVHVEHIQQWQTIWRHSFVIYNLLLRTYSDLETSVSPIGYFFNYFYLVLKKSSWFTDVNPVSLFLLWLFSRFLRIIKISTDILPTRYISLGHQGWNLENKRQS